MKKIIVLLLFCAISQAQTPILSLYNDSRNIQGAYYKDTQNEFNRFVGEWKYKNGNDTLIVRIIKKEMQFIDYGHISVYEDFLVGEYRFVQNGIEKINTLPSILSNFVDPYEYNINANIIKRPTQNNPDVCPHCGPNDVIIRGSLRDPNIEILGLEPTVFMRSKTENGVEKIFFSLVLFGNVFVNVDEGYPPHTSYRLPSGTYELIKQP
jgi:hypothetical protein